MSNHHTEPRPASSPAHAEVEDLIELLDAIDGLPAAASLRRTTYRALALQPGSRVIDVGCGTGLAVGEMADLGATATGVDVDARMVQAARRRRPTLDLRQAGADALPIPDGELTAYRADKVFHELSDPRQSLGEAHRALTCGGRLALLGQDWDALIIDSSEPELTRRVVAARADALPNPRAARGYRTLLADAGFAGIRVEGFLAVFTDPLALPMVTGFADAAHELGAVSTTEATRWVTDQRHRATSDRLLLAIPLILATAHKPE